MSLWIKICGLTTSEAVVAATTAGADAIGFVFAPSPRRVSPQRAAELAAEAPAHVQRVAVMLHPAQALLDEVLDVLQPDVLQSDVEDLRAMRLPSSLQLLPVLRSGIERPSALPPRVLFEGAKSGSGTTADWAAATDLALATQLVLAGGLTPDNVGSAIRTVRPYGVDVSSGVEASPGVKDADKIVAFVRAARAASEARKVSAR